MFTAARIGIKERTRSMQETPQEAARFLSAHRRLRTVAVVAATAVLLALTPWFSIMFGAASVPPGEAIALVLNHIPGINLDVTWDRVTEAIIWDNRMPRVLTGVGTGAILGVTGVAFQAVVRNPLAEPYVLGVSSGAAVGAATAIIVVGVTASVTVTGFAFVGAVAATAIVLSMGGRHGGSTLRLVLAGLAVGFVCQALTNLIIFSARTAETAQAVVFWTLGSLTRPSWVEVGFIIAVAVIITAGMWLAGPILDALASGDDTCVAIGINPALTRVLVLIPASGAVAIAVAQCGGIGFIGLVIPHLMRPLVGYAHRWLVVCTAMASGVFLTLTDTVARTLFSPLELPIGVITGLIGAPFLLLMLNRTSGW